MNKRLVATFAALALAACSDTQIFQGNPDNAKVADEDFVESTELKGADLDGLWERAEQVVMIEGYEVDGTRTHFADREMATHWNAVMGMNRYEGYRTRAYVRFHKSKKGEWTVGVLVQRQRNIDIRRPSEEVMATWEEQPADKARAGVLLWKIESGFREPGSEEPTPKSATK
jgi:hypothetical protein